jgi:hypothetical protein
LAATPAVVGTSIPEFLAMIGLADRAPGAGDQTRRAILAWLAFQTVNGNQIGTSVRRLKSMSGSSRRPA